jgi:aspartyl aminopeptidase
MHLVGVHLAQFRDALQDVGEVAQLVFELLRGLVGGPGEEAEGGDCCDVWAMFDNEEVGSQTRQGAAGSFLPDVMARIEAVYGLNAEDSVRAKANAFFLSVDNGHATHPNHPEKSDPAHPIALNGGVVVKLTANQKYTTTAMTSALFREICRRANVPTQVFYNRPDVIGGGTLGNILSRAVSVPMADIGLPQLSMHSAMETAGTKDVAFMVRAVKAFYETRLAQTADGTWTIG